MIMTKSARYCQRHAPRTMRHSALWMKRAKKMAHRYARRRCRQAVRTGRYDQYCVTHSDAGKARVTARDW